MAKSSEAKDLFVDRDGVAGHGCSNSITRDANNINNPWCTIQKSATTAQAGDTVNIRTGTYNEQVTPQVTGTVGNIITFQNYNSEVVTVDGQNTRTACLSFSVSYTSDYITISGIIFKNSTQDNIWLNGKQYITFSGIESSYAGRYGIYSFGASHNITINNNSVITQNQNTGIYITNGSYSVTIDGNTISYNGLSGANEKDGIGAKNDSGDYVYDIHITNNTINNNFRQGILSFRNRYSRIAGNTIYANGATGIQLELGVLYNIVEDNIIYANQQSYTNECGIWLDETQYSVVRNNTVYSNEIGIQVGQSHYNIIRNNKTYNNNKTSITANRGYSLSVGASQTNDPPTPTGSSYNRFMHNVSYNDSRSASIYGAASLPLAAHANLLYNKFVNNIIINSQSLYTVYLDTDTDAMDNVNYNVYFPVGNFYWNGASRDYDTYKSLSGFDTNSLTSDPLFTDVSSYDFNLPSGSPAVNAGTFLTVTVGSGSGTSMVVADPYFFFDGYGLEDVVGDTIQLQGQTATAVITNVNYEIRTLTLDTPLTWTNGQGIAFVYSGSAPDIGAYEYVFTDTVPPSAPTGLMVQ